MVPDALQDASCLRENLVHGFALLAIEKVKKSQRVNGNTKMAATLEY